MTTKAAEELYRAQHNFEMEGKGYHLYNPHNKPIEELPCITGFNNGGMSGMLQALAIAEDGHILGEHLCSHENYMTSDLGVLEGTRPDRHKESYQKHYPDGYRMRFVSADDAKEDAVLTEALRKNRELDIKDNTNQI